MKKNKIFVFGGSGEVGSLVCTFLEKNKISYKASSTNKKRQFIKFDATKKISQKISKILIQSNIIIFALKKNTKNLNFKIDLMKLIFFEIVFPLFVINQFDTRNKTFVFFGSDSTKTFRAKKIYILSKVISYIFINLALKKLFKSKMKICFLKKNKLENSIIVNNFLTKLLR